MLDQSPIRVGVIGTGFIARHFILAMQHVDDVDVTVALTRRPVDSVSELPSVELTNSPELLLERSDLILECSGDPIHATTLVAAAVRAGLPVVTMSTEFHITSGSWFVGQGLVTEAEGDQPGCQAALAEDARSAGFRPLVYGNMKGFLNEDPTREEMEYWGERQGISLPMVTSFTDGTKVQAEQILVGNYFGADVAQEGMLGLETDDIRGGAEALAAASRDAGTPITDYLLSSVLPHGVFLVAEHEAEQAAALSYIKLGDGPFYVLQKPNILVHLEILKTIRRVRAGGGALLDNSAMPTLSLGAVAKRDLDPGERLPLGIGSFDLRGHAVRIREHADHVPIGLIQNALVRRPLERGQLLSFDDVELPESLARTAWDEISERVVTATA